MFMLVSFLMHPIQFVKDFHQTSRGLNPDGTENEWLRKP